MACKELSVTVVIRIDKDLDAALLEWRRRQPDVPNQSEAIRRILRQVVV